MDVLIPYQVAQSHIAASNVAENDHPQWAATADYLIGQYVISTATHKVYRALKESGPNKGGAQSPDREWVAIDDVFNLTATQPTYWDRISATNLYKLFDETPSEACSHRALIDVTLAMGRFVEGIALFNLFADTVQITVFSDSGTEYDKTFTLTDNAGVVGWWTYYTSPIIETTQLIATDLPYLPSGKVRLKINRANGVAACGEIVPGSLLNIGKTETKPKIKIFDCPS